MFDIDIEHCPHCGGTLKIIADPAPIPGSPFHPQGAQQGQSLARAFELFQMA